MGEEEPMHAMLLKLPKSLMDKVHAWRAQQPDVPNASEAIRRMVEAATDKVRPIKIRKRKAT